jgi:hypothetical protein
MRLMLSDSGIAPTYHPCNGVWLPDTGKIQKAKKITNSQRNQIGDSIAALLKNARDHTTIHAGIAYTNPLYKRLADQWEARNLNTATQDDRAIVICVVLQRVASELLLLGGSTANAGFSSSPSFIDRVALKKANGWTSQ